MANNCLNTVAILNKLGLKNLETKAENFFISKEHIKIFCRG